MNVDEPLSLGYPCSSVGCRGVLRTIAVGPPTFKRKDPAIVCSVCDVPSAEDLRIYATSGSVVD